MRRLRTLSSRRLVAVAAAAVAQAGLIGSDPKPEPKALDRAIADAVNSPAPDGVRARISFTNGLLPSGSLPGGSSTPLLTGAEGRLWLAGDGRLRLELQSERGDAQIVSDGERLTVYDATSKTLYRLALPRDGADETAKPERGPV